MDLDNRVFGMMITKFAWSDFLKGVKYTDEKTGEEKAMSEEEKFETVISLLEKGMLYIAALGGGKLSIMPNLDEEQKFPDITKVVDLGSLKGRYKEFSKLQKDFERSKWEE